MRIFGALLIAVMLASCVGPPRERPRSRGSHSRLPARPSNNAPVFDERAYRQCLVDLGQRGARFTPLPNRVFGGGCSAIGTVQLLDIGMPTTNLGAMTCPLADKFVDWTQNALQKAATAWLDSPVVKVESFGTYSCRPVNNVAGNALSQHGYSNAVDISGFVLANGRRITVLADWNGPDPDARNFLRAVHAAACRRFRVVLGPDANAIHRNHLHFDMGRGPYCK